MIHPDQLNARIKDIPLPERMQHLPVDPRGFPVPWFVSRDDDGNYDFRAIEYNRIGKAVKQRLCWLCGQTLGRRLALVIGPMCIVNRVTSEPPSHRECAEYAVQACPFLAQPKMRRNEKDLPEDAIAPAGVHLMRNPGVMAIWITHSYHVFRPDPRKAGVLFRIGDPVAVTYYREGRIATRAEILESIESGLPFLSEIAAKQGADALRDLDQQHQQALKLLPAA
jgi:hypothetical protein